jgi:hypothetical protein
MKQYHTKQEAHNAGYIDGYDNGFNAGIAQEKARAKKKLDPHYNRPVSLKERVDRESEVEVYSAGEVTYEWQGLGMCQQMQPSLWQRLTRPIIRELKGFFRP